MDNDTASSSDDWSNSLTTAQKIVIATIMSVCSTGIILLCSYMFFQAFTECKRRRRRREYLAGMVELQQQQRMGIPTDCGLGREDLEAMPVFIYAATTRRGEGRPECAVCLGEFGEGEMGKVLPICRHTFHKECIDMWLCSHTTCPLCRSNVKS